MRKMLILFVVVLIGFTSCTDSKQSMTVTVTDSLALEQAGGIIEVPMSDMVARLKLADTVQIVVLDVDGQQVPYQATCDEGVVFPVTVGGNSVVTCTIQPGTPAPLDAIAYGKYYPERLDDVAWENDLDGLHAYGPALQVCGERGFGYDLFTKYNTTEPILESLCAEELSPEKRAKITELKKADPKAASELRNAISYHVDHGYGMDRYAVGPTLGAGVAALMVGDTIIYPYCYRTQEILDNDPLRLTVKLGFNLLVIRGDSNMVKTRVISLDVGSYLNKTVVSYTNLKGAMPVTTGLVLHEPDGAVMADATSGYITYIDPTTNRSNADGKIFVGAVSPAQVKEAKAVPLSEKEKRDRGGADGHVLAISGYEPGSECTYYWESAWNKTTIRTPGVRDKYMTGYAQELHTPLVVAY